MLKTPREGKVYSDKTGNVTKVKQADVEKEISAVRKRRLKKSSFKKIPPGGARKNFRPAG
ncbi:MAG: hypothetical protein ABSE59_01800 [Opitutaceae bacterium]|jgi:hypothetical protein